MMLVRSLSMFGLLVGLTLGGCGAPSSSVDSGTLPSDSGSASPLLWYETCGDPVCSGYTGPFEDVPACTSETLGAACSTENSACDPVDDCNKRYTCAASDPTQQPGGCPVSKARHKAQIRYLPPAERDALAAQALSLRIASWRYRTEAPSGPEHIGFMIDDMPKGPAVRPDGEHVDLYGYTTMAIAAAQSQAARIEEQERELQSLRQALDALRGTLEQDCARPSKAAN